MNYPPLKVERDMPWAERDKIYPRDKEGWLIIPLHSLPKVDKCFNSIEVDFLIKDGWLSEVVEEKKSLIGMFGSEQVKLISSDSFGLRLHIDSAEKLAKLSNTAHLEAFDRAIPKVTTEENYMDLMMIRKALEDVVKK